MTLFIFLKEKKLTQRNCTYMIELNYKVLSSSLLTCFLVLMYIAGVIDMSFFKKLNKYKQTVLVCLKYA